MPGLLTDVGHERRFIIAAGVAFVAIALLSAGDLATDLGEGVAWSHLATEATVMAFGAIGAVVVAFRYRSLQQHADAARAESDELRALLRVESAEAARWRRETATLLDGLGKAIDEQFQRWALSPAESEVALLLLKGLAHKDIALVRGVSEPTVRQQARAAYKKGGLAGRHELAAFFLEDLLLPAQQRGPVPESVTESD